MQHVVTTRKNNKNMFYVVCITNKEIPSTVCETVIYRIIIYSSCTLIQYGTTHKMKRQSWMTYMMYFLFVLNKMSTCNTGRPPADATFQNLVVNDQLRVNNVLKSTKGEIERLCSVYARQQLPLIGTYLDSRTSLDPPPLQNISTYVVPVGNTTQAIALPSPTIASMFYTDAELRVDKFQATVIGAGAQLIPGLTFNVSISVTQNIPTPIPSDILTLSMPNVTTTLKQSTNETGTVHIPANSFISIHIDISAASGEIAPGCMVQWLLLTTKV